MVFCITLCTFSQVFYYGKIWEKAQTMNSFRDKVSAFLKGPGWFPGTPRLGDIKGVPKVSRGVSLNDGTAVVKTVQLQVVEYVIDTNPNVFLLLYEIISQDSDVNQLHSLISHECRFCSQLQK